ncbi:MAG: AraC family transcriptional regulator [Clostridiales bacterium]|nr:AraC family transcriptional regulator [Clostridiales bacterium]
MQIFVNEMISSGFRISHIMGGIPKDMKRAHIHREYEIFYLVSGQRYYFIEDKTYQIQPGSLVMVQSGDVHRTVQVFRDQPYERILLMLRGEYVQPVLNALNLPPVSFFFTTPVLSLSTDKQATVKNIFDTLFSELSTKPANHDSVSRLKIVELLLLASRCLAFSADLPGVITPSSGKYKKVNDAILYIKDHFLEPLSLGEIADHIYVSRGYLSKIFNETTGMKVTDYINIQRINYSKNLFAGNSDLSITELAEICGFDSITYYEKVFKQVTGISPTSFRKSLQAEKT